MRYLVFGDVHGNLPALEKMLAIEKGSYDYLVSHGDVVNYGPWSNECTLLLKNEKSICLKGNHEQYFLEGSYPGQNVVAKTFFEFCYPHFFNKEIISKYIDHFDVAGFRIIHSINNEYFYPDTDLSSHHFDRNYIVGHSHYSFFRMENGFKIYNTGSVGQNRKYINIINYLVLDTKTNEVAMKALPYDVDIVINEMKQQNYPQLCLDYYNQKKRI